MNKRELSKTTAAAVETHAHPTLPEAMLEAALGFRDAAIHTHSR